MSESAEQILAQALRLPDGERGELVAQLIDSFNPPVEDTDPSLWEAEIRARLDDLDRGLVQAVPWTEARRAIHEDTEARSGG
jgi:putative addiction module component (TIGR02574 family)